jgi:hypothetical protein
MQKVFVFLCVLALSFSSFTPAQAESAAPAAAAVVDEKTNPIEKAFAPDFASAVATPEIGAVAEAYYDAWKAELQAVSNQIKKAYPVKDDVKRVDAYLADYENLAQKAFDLEMLNWLDDPEKPVSERSFGTGGPGAAMLAQARIYKQATLNLITHLQAMNPDVAYTFTYKGKGADLDTLRKQNR